MVAVISWTKNLVIMEKCKEDLERELEQGLISHIREFLAEMGGTFTFIGNQYHIKVDNEDFYIAPIPLGSYSNVKA